jgi:flagellar assembly factor FliW
MMNLNGTRFGDIEYTPDDVLTFSEGMIGFNQCKQFVLLCPTADSPFRWLQSIQEPALAFLLANPVHFVSDYAPSVDEVQASSLDLDEGTPTLIFATASIPHGKPDEMTLNLAAPIVINAETQHAKQLVLDGDAYTIKHRVFPAANQASEKQAA